MPQRDIDCFYMIGRGIVQLGLYTQYPHWHQQGLQRAEHICCGGFISSTSNLASWRCLVVLLVERMPCLVRFMCPLSVAVDGGKYLLINSWDKPGNVRSWLFLMAARIVDGGADKNTW